MTKPRSASVLKVFETNEMCKRLDAIAPGQKIIYSSLTYSHGCQPTNLIALRYAYKLYLDGKIVLFQKTNKPPQTDVTKSEHYRPRTFDYIAIGLNPPFVPVKEHER